ncbi:MAG: GntR family transcriptional regulator [Planctomycetales bacterium]|nr:GntR family transcriptional regulator [Planctomycetales bacterium]
MFFKIDPDNGVAIYDQIVRQIKFAVADKAVLPGELVPSVRELARQLAVNPNTVARAYRQLQDDKILSSVRGTGLQVTAGAHSKCTNARQQIVRNRLKEVLNEAAGSGLTQSEVRELIETAISAIQWEASHED